MRLHNLSLKNIGPFKEAALEFIREGLDDIEQPPVIIITGENGTGKTIVLDAIRQTILPHIITRDIVRDDDFSISLDGSLKVKSPESEEYKESKTRACLDKRDPKGASGTFVQDARNAYGYHLADTFGRLEKGKLTRNNTFISPFVVDYWTPTLEKDAFKIDKLVSPKFDDYLVDGLSGTFTNKDITQLLVYYDYLRNSEEEDEQHEARFTFDVFKKIFDFGIEDGGLGPVKRAELTPQIISQGQKIPLGSASNGNLYMIQRLLSLFHKMIAASKNHDLPIEQCLNIRGLLLIDEAENHLHPKWQKSFMSSIQALFPNLQLILTTHSPFIVASVANSRVYVCESKGDHSVIIDATDDYANQPINQVLESDAFDGTRPYNTHISKLLEELEQAVEKGDDATRSEKIKALKAANPNHFFYMDFDPIMQAKLNPNG